MCLAVVTIFGVVTLSTLLHRNKRFGRTCCLHLKARRRHNKMEVVGHRLYKSIVQIDCTHPPDRSVTFLKALVFNL